MRQSHVKVLGLVLGVTVIAGSPLIAESSCNSAPTSSEVRFGHTAVMVENADGTMMPLPSSMATAFRYKAALGRVDGVFFAPGPREQLRFASDGLCASGPAPGPSPRIKPMGGIDDIALFIAFDPKPGRPIPVWPYAQQPQFPLGRLREAMGELPPAPGSHVALPVDFVLNDWDPRVRALPIRGEVGGLQVPVPSLFGEAGAADVSRMGRELDSSSVRVLAIHMGKKTPVALAAELSEFLATPCVDICDKLQGSGAELCVDEIFTVRPSDDIETTFMYAPDSMLCSVDIVGTFEDNIFADVCDSGLLNQNAIKVMAGSPPPVSSSPAGILTAEVFDPELTQCNPATSTLKFWRSSCGGIHFPLNYDKIRVRQLLDGSQHSKVKRRLGGTSGFGRGSDADDRRIYVPGREFVGSTPQLDSSARSPDVHWRLPELDVWYPDGQESNEFGLVGVADKDQSIVHVFPRIRATYVCGVPERGCMAVDSLGDKCACADTGLPGCTCTHLNMEGRYFACSGGDRDNMPCTRDAHCKSRDTSRPSGTCSREPICRPENSVWYRVKGGEDDPANATHCSWDSQCADGEQCGYSLFDFSNRMNTLGWHYLDRDVVLLPPSGRVRRGACAPDRKIGCSNAGAPGFLSTCPDSNRCRGYRLAAGSELP